MKIAIIALLLALVALAGCSDSQGVSNPTPTPTPTPCPALSSPPEPNDCLNIPEGLCLDLCWCKVATAGLRRYGFACIQSSPCDPMHTEIFLTDRCTQTQKCREYDDAIEWQYHACGDRWR